jgi:hypothetical protein
VLFIAFLPSLSLLLAASKGSSCQSPAILMRLMPGTSLPYSRFAYQLEAFFAGTYDEKSGCSAAVMMVVSRFGGRALGARESTAGVIGFISDEPLGRRSS